MSSEGKGLNLYKLNRYSIPTGMELPEQFIRAPSLAVAKRMARLHNSDRRTKLTLSEGQYNSHVWVWLLNGGKY